MWARTGGEQRRPGQKYRGNRYYILGSSRLRRRILDPIASLDPPGAAA
jgi:hypothetical protein